MQLDIQSTRNRTIINFKKLGYNDLQVLGKYKYTKTEKILAEHTHSNMIEICYCDNGSQFFFVNNKKYIVTGGDVFIHFPNEKHSTGGMPESKGSLYWFIIKLCNPADTHLACFHILFLIKQIIQKNIRHFKGGNDIKKQLEIIYNLSAKNEKQLIQKQIQHIAIENSVQKLFLLLINKIASNKANLDADKRLSVVTTFISKNLTDTLPISMLAELVHLSNSRFKTWFKQHTGFTPIDFIQRQRVFEVIKIIKQNPDISISSVAYQFNFSTPQYFSKVIKKYTGKTPIEIKNGI